MLPPHGRGWTLDRPCNNRVNRASPARAGMDPFYEVDNKTVIRFPRTGGDGPHFG